MRFAASIPLSILFAATPSLRGSDAATLWSQKVQPLLDLQCVKCHGPIEQKGGLELDTPQAVLKGGEDGHVVEPGKPDQSPLFSRLAEGVDAHMPPKKQLTASEREIVREWIMALASAQPAASAGPNPGKTTPRTFASASEAVDTLVSEGWKKRGTSPAKPLEDTLWCRRVYLDIAGRIPTRDETHDFLKAAPDTRRTDLVEKLLASNEYAVRMRELWDTFLMGRAKRPGQEDRRRQNGWWTFLETAFRKNRPWDETVRAILAARPDKPEDKGATWFLYERKNDHQAIAEGVAPVVYGTKIDCAQCHDHPLAREIKQSHYWGLVTAYNRSKNVEGSSAITESAVGGFVNFTNLKKESQPAVVTLLTGRSVAESWPAGDAKEEDSDDKYVDPKAKVRVPKFSRREAFADVATHENPLLARAFVNRMWAALFGRGLVNPADEMTTRNAPSHPELLDWLAEDFAKSGYDVRRFVRAIVLSQPYALGAGDSAPDSFGCMPERILTGEQIARSWRIAAGLPPEDEPLRRATVVALPDVLPKEYNATFQQAQFLANAPLLAQTLKPETGTLNKLAALQDPSEKVREAFQSAYGRAPEPDELAQSLAFLSARPNQPAEAARDLLWALITSAEFLTMP